MCVGGGPPPAIGVPVMPPHPRPGMQGPDRGVLPGVQLHMTAAVENEVTHAGVRVGHEPEPPPAQHSARSPRRVNPHAGVAANYKPAAIVATRTRPCRTVVVPA